jgi:uncharacterized OB-fold protein
MSDAPQPEIDAINQPYWDALETGELRYQSCENGHAWLPPRSACPTCLSRAVEWKTSSGNGRIVSWVVYRVAYHDAFKDRVPYNVAIVALQEGPRLITNILAEPEQLTMEAPVRLTIDRRSGTALACFSLT